MKIFLALFIFASPVLAIDYKCNKKMDTFAFEQQLDIANITHSGVGCENEVNCIIKNASENPSSVCAAYVYAFVDYGVISIANHQRARILAQKFVQKRITADEQMELLGLIINAVFGP